MLALQCRTGIRERPSGAHPLGITLPDVMKSMEVVAILSQLPGSSPAPRPKPVKRQHEDSEDADTAQPLSRNAARKQRRAQARVTLTPATPPAAVKQEPKVKGKGKGKAPKVTKGPKALAGMHLQMADGKAKCYAYHLEGCTAARPGQACPKGVHTCVFPGCNKAHTLSEHKSGH